MAPDFGESWGGYTSWGCLTRSVRDAAAMIDVMAGPAAGDPYSVPPLARPLAEEVGAPPGNLRVAFTAASLFGKKTHLEAGAAVESTARLLADGALDYHGRRGSIHQIANLIKPAASNGWQAWYFVDTASGERRSIDSLRQQLRSLLQTKEDDK